MKPLEFTIGWLQQLFDRTIMMVWSLVQMTFYGTKEKLIYTEMEV